MRVFLLALVFLTGSATAQSQYADGEGTYLSFDEFRLSSSGGSVDRFALGGEVGRRLGNGVDVGVIGSYGVYHQFDDVRTSGWTLGATAGLTRPGPLGTQAHLRGVAAYTAASISTLTVDDVSSRYERMRATGDLTATLARTVPVVGSVRLQPTVGMYGLVTQMLSVAADDAFPRPDGPAFDAGLQVELPVRFRLFGTEVALSPAMRYSFARGLRPGTMGLGGGLVRVNF